MTLEYTLLNISVLKVNYLSAHRDKVTLRVKWSTCVCLCTYMFVCVCVGCCRQLSRVSHWAFGRSRFLGLAACNVESQQSRRARRESLWEPELRLLAFINPCNEARDGGAGSICTSPQPYSSSLSLCLQSVSRMDVFFVFFYIILIHFILFQKFNLVKNTAAKLWWDE